MTSHMRDIDDEDLTFRACCAPFATLTEPIDLTALEYVVSRIEASSPQIPELMYRYA